MHPSSTTEEVEELPLQACGSILRRHFQTKQNAHEQLQGIHSLVGAMGVDNQHLKRALRPPDFLLW